MCERPEKIRLYSTYFVNSCGQEWNTIFSKYFAFSYAYGLWAASRNRRSYLLTYYYHDTHSTLWFKCQPRLGQLQYPFWQVQSILFPELWFSNVKYIQRRDIYSQEEENVIRHMNLSLFHQLTVLLVGTVRVVQPSISWHSSLLGDAGRITDFWCKKFLKYFEPWIAFCTYTPSKRVDPDQLIVFN